MSALQLDWIEQLIAAAPAPEYLAAVEAALARYPEDATGTPSAIRQSLVWHRAALLGQHHGGAALPSDVRFRDGQASIEVSLITWRYHAWAISDSHMEMAGGFGNTPELARARAMVGLMLSINESVHRRLS
jgi:hypothetical protein